MDVGLKRPVERVRELAAQARDLLQRTDPPGVARRAAATALVIRIGNAGLAYFAQVVLARLMGQFEYGVFAYTWVWFMVFSAVSTLGFGDSPVRYIAMLRERGESDHLRGYLRFSVLVIILASVGAAILIAALLPLAASWIGQAYILPLALMGLALPFAGLQSFLEGIGRSYGWTVPALLPIYILRHGLLLVFMASAVALGVEATAVNAFICLIAVLAVSLIYQAGDILWRLRGVLEPGPHAYRPREWVRGSAPFALLYGGAHLSSVADVLVLSFFVSPAEIAIYFAATRIIHVVNVVPFAATVGTAHLFSASHTRGDRKEMQRLCNHVTNLTFAISIAAVGVLLLAGHQLLGMFGEGFDAGFTPLVILAVAVIVRVATGPAEDILNMTGNSGLSAWSYLVMVGFNVVLAVALIIPYGINGAALASGIALVVRSLWLMLAVRRRLAVKTSIVASFATLGAFRPTVRIHPFEARTPAE